MPRRDSHLPSHPGGHYYYYPSSSAGGVDAWTKAESDARYFRPDVGGEIRGNVIFAGEVRDDKGLPFSRLRVEEVSPDPSDIGAEGTLWAFTGTGSPGGGVSQIQLEDDDTDAAVVSLLRFQGSVVSVSGGIATFDLDSRYRLQEAKIPWGDLVDLPDYATRWPTPEEVGALPITGGTLQGDLDVLGEVLADSFQDRTGFDLAHIHAWDQAPDESDLAPDGTLWAYTGPVGSGGVSQIQLEDDDTDATEVSLLRFQGSVVSVSGGIADLDLDSRYSQVGHGHSWEEITGKPKYATRWPTPEEVGALPITGGTLQGDLTVDGTLADTSGYALAHVEAADYGPGNSVAPDGTLWAYTGDPTAGVAPAEHTHRWSDIENPPVYATRWPTLAEIGAAPAEHNHDGRYLRLTGGTLTGNLYGQMIRSARPIATNYALVAQMETDSQPRWFVEAQGRMRWGDGAGTNLGMVWPSEGYLRSSVGFYAEGASVIAPDAPTPLTLRRNNSQNNVTILWENSAGDRIYAGMRTANSFAIGRSANLSDSPWISVSPNRITAPVLIEAPEIYDPESRPYSRLEIREQAPGPGDLAPDGTLWAYTGSGGSGGGSPQVQVEDDNTGATIASLLRFQGDVLSVSSGIAYFNLDGRYLRTTGGTIQGPLELRGPENGDTDLLRFGDRASGYGFWWRYAGSGTSNENNLELWTDNITGTPLRSLHIKQDGILRADVGLMVAGYEAWHAGNFSPSSKADVGHTHDSRYLQLTGGTLSGNLRVGSGLDGVQVQDAGFINLYRGGYQIQLNANWGAEGNFARLGPQQTALALRLTGRPNSSNIGIHIDTQDRVGIGRVPDSGYALDVAGAGRVGGPLVVSNQGDGAKLLELNSERGWAFYQRGTSGSARLELRALTAGKWFDIAGVGGGRIASFYGSDTNPAQVRLVPDGGTVTISGNTTIEGDVTNDYGHKLAPVNVHGSAPTSSDLARDGTLWCIV